MSYEPFFLFRSGHFNSIYTSLFRAVPQLSYNRERIYTHDEDFLDLDFVKNGHARVVILCHGLEGSSESKYMIGTGALLSKNQFDVCAMNYRFCSGEINLKPQMYHSGWTPDLHTVVEYCAKDYDEIYLAGFSLGGNLVLKYLGEHLFKRSAKIKAACAISVPLNLSSSSEQMEQFQNRLYTWRFLKTLNEKIKQKSNQFPALIDTKYISRIKSVRDFDNYYTGPLNGFEDAEDYYEKCSSDQFLSSIKVPTLVINSKDDPFLGKKCFPAIDEVKNILVHLNYTTYGGHVGFYQNGQHMWFENEILDFFVRSNK
ncbi:YheT family hydrolase [Portibacter marinus]|uniref:YheT family hydrolase n=1 Tax=Portibacter marinus TaxID=2898660 RepID=UPI001F33C58E|nr:alpha/beta fold hydrolase [Portibacter marinus]